MSLAAQAGQVIREARGDRSQRAVAKALGMAASSLNELEAGRDNPTLERLERVAAGLGIRLAIVQAGPDPLSVPCSYCKAAAGEPCRHPVRITEPARTHPTRSMAAAEAEAELEEAST